MQTVRKIDGFGTRKDGSGGEVVNLNEEPRFIELFAQESIAKGDIVALSIDSAIDGTDSTDYGYGNIVKKAASGTPAIAQVLGVAAEAVTLSSDDVSNAAWKKISIQVRGRCEFVKVADVEGGGASPAPGNLLIASSTAGQAEAYAAAAVTAAFGIHLEDGTDGAADSVVYLINPLNA